MAFFSWHSHIKGIGGFDQEHHDEINVGLIGHKHSRKSAKIISDMLKKKKKKSNYINRRKHGIWKNRTCFINSKRNWERCTFLHH